MRGLDPDGWLAPGGETERALHAAAADLARAKGGEWLRFAERASRAQAGLSGALQGRQSLSDLTSDVLDQRTATRPEAAAEEEIIPAQSRTGFGRLPGPIFPWSSIHPDDQETVPGSPADALTKFVDALGRYAGSGGRYGIGARREALPESDRPGTRLENVPPRVPDEPHRGPDPERPPLDAKQARPSPYPSESPHTPEQERLAPPRIDPREFILITPDQSEEFAKYIFIERRGNEKTRDGLEIIAQAARNVAQKRSDVSIKHIGGSRNEAKQEVKEHWVENRDLRDQGKDARKGSSYADLTIEVEGKLIHISFYRAKADGSPKPIEIEQAERLAYNTRPANLVIMIENKYGREAIDQKALERFLDSVVDAVRAGAGRDNVNVRNPQVRDRIIRYFNAYKPR